MPPPDQAQPDQALIIFTHWRCSYFVVKRLKRCKIGKLSPKKVIFGHFFWSEIDLFSQNLLQNQCSYMNKNFEPIFCEKLRTCKKGSNRENLRTTEPQKNLLVLTKKKCVYWRYFPFEHKYVFIVFLQISTFEPLVRLILGGQL